MLGREDGSSVAGHVVGDYNEDDHDDGHCKTNDLLVFMITMSSLIMIMLIGRRS